jgi:hypothetical protein
VKFIDVLHRTRRQRKPNPVLQERIAAYSLRAFWGVKAAPVNPPVTENPRG